MDALNVHRRRLCTGLLLTAAGASHAQSSEEAEAELRIKAAFLHRFASYVEWPEAPETFQIGVLGSDAMLVELHKLLDGRRILERPVQLRRLRAGDPLSGLQLLYVAGSEVARAPFPRGLLLVTEGEGGLSRGGIINFLLVERRVRFEVGLAQAERAGLRLSSRLLAVALRVQAAGGN